MSNHQPTILLVLTSHGDLGGVKSTGFYVPEAAEPWEIFTAAGYSVEVASIAGGQPPRNGYDPESPLQQAFFEAIDTVHTPTVADVDPARYSAVHFVGGHGTMWDFPNNDAIAFIVNNIYSRGGVVSAVCHGQAAFVGLTRNDGEPFVDGYSVTSYSNAEEAAIGLDRVVPFLLEDTLANMGAAYTCGEPFTEYVTVDRRLVNGQNGQSARAGAAAVLSELSNTFVTT